MAHPDDELLSALLDGEVAQGDAAHVDDCPECQARLAALRGVTNALADVPVPPGHLREAALAAALRTADEPLRVAALTGVGRAVPMRSARRAAARPRRMNSLSAAAALVVALGVGGWAISQIGTGSDRTGSTSALRAGVADDSNEAATPTAGLGSDNATLSDDAKSSTTAVNSLTAAAPTAAPAGPYDGGDLGSVNDIAVVSQRAEADLDQPADTRQTKTMTDPSPCPSSEPNVVVWQATLTYNGEAAVAHLVKMSDGSQVMQILRRAGCSLIASQDFAPKSSR